MATLTFFTAPLTGDAVFQTADATTQKTVVTIDSPGGVGFSLSFTNSCGSDVTMVVSRKHNTNATVRLIREIKVKAGAGIDGAAVTEFFDSSLIPALASVAALQDGYKLGGSGYSMDLVVNAKAALPAGAVTCQFVGGQG